MGMIDVGGLHPKLKGNLGEARVASDLIRRGYPVFIEFGDLSRVDLVAEVAAGRFVRLQVKCYKSREGRVVVKSEKSGPGYRYRYQSTDVDLFAIYVYDRDILLYVPSAVICNRIQTTFRIDPTRNGQTASVRHAAPFCDFDAALRGVEPTPL